MSGIFDLFNVTCKRHHSTALNPSFKWYKNSEVDGTCKRSLTLCKWDPSCSAERGFVPCLRSLGPSGAVVKMNRSTHVYDDATMNRSTHVYDDVTMNHSTHISWRYIYFKSINFTHEQKVTMLDSRDDCEFQKIKLLFNSLLSAETRGSLQLGRNRHLSLNPPWGGHQY